MRWIHIAGGLIGTASDATALVASKGAVLHRWSGRVSAGDKFVNTNI
jgi:hypothetical protein